VAQARTAEIYRQVETKPEILDSLELKTVSPSPTGNHSICTKISRNWRLFPLPGRIRISSHHFDPQFVRISFGRESL
jgi:hypothetical protein